MQVRWLGIAFSARSLGLGWSTWAQLVARHVPGGYKQGLGVPVVGTAKLAKVGIGRRALMNR